jgi:hypothetical protein
MGLVAGSTSDQFEKHMSKRVLRPSQRVAFCSGYKMGKRLDFWKTHGLMGGGLKTLHRSFLSSPRKRKAPLAKAMDGSSWFAQVNANDSLSLEHIVQFYTLWEMLQSVHIDANIPDTLTWKLSNNGCYSSKSAYNMQNLGQTSSLLPRLVWEPWAHPECKTFA